MARKLSAGIVLREAGTSGLRGATSTITRANIAAQAARLLFDSESKFERTAAALYRARSPTVSENADMSHECDGSSPLRQCDGHLGHLFRRPARRTAILTSQSLVDFKGREVTVGEAVATRHHEAGIHPSGSGG